MRYEPRFEELLSGRSFTLRFAVLRLRHTLAQFLDRFPWLFLRVFYRVGAVVNDETEIVIDGYARSANSFSSRALRQSQGREVKTAGFKHYSSHIILGVRMGKPVLVLVRDPDQAALSLRVCAPHFTMRQLLRRWIIFHKRIKPYRDHFVVATFDQVTGDFSSVIERVNRRFGTNFRPFERSEQNMKEIFSQMDRARLDSSGRTVQSMVSHPSEQRDHFKESVRSELLAPECEQLRREAQRLYQEFVSYAQERVDSPLQAED